MKLPQKLNVMLASDLEDSVRGLKDCLLVDHGGLDGMQTFEFRGRLKKLGCRMRVVKNSLAKAAFERAGLGALSGHLKGSSAVLYGKDDVVVSLAKVVSEWNKDKARKPVPVKAGLLAGAPLAPADVERLAAIPPRKELMARLAGGIQAPVTGLACALNGTARKLALALKAVAEQKAQAVA